MDLKLIRNLLKLMERNEVTELEIEDEKAGLKVHLKRGHEPVAPVSPAPVVNLMSGAAAAPPPPPRGAEPAEPAAEERAPDVAEITSPMVGTFYTAASPEAEPFAPVGTTLDEETTVCIIEAMKVMNEIKAECRGEIFEVLVENGDAVEYGQPLFLVKTA
ncbi:MAG: acetyl-CoA carboxylase biotin carboxyl carrier protein [Planctomycetota bacterium]|nr:MAG: acetyl-CoA carboxylase biotin carboxyl carrier protein [Planctomycetota bacterium]